MRCMVIVNPNSGRRQAQKNLEQILGQLAMEQGCSQIDVVKTAGFDDARQAAAALKPGQYDFVIGCGGDGTLNEIVNGLMQSGSDLPLAMLPAGTVNDFGNHLCLPCQPDEFCTMIRNNWQRRIDLGLANGQYFVNVAAFGMFTDVAHKTRSKNKSILGKLAYYLQGVRDIPEQLFNTMDLEITIDGQSQRYQALVCIIANSTSVGGVRNLVPKAKVDDGLLNLLLLARPERISLEMLFDALIEGDFSVGALRHIAIEKASFNVVQQEVDLDLDGEYRGCLPLEVEVVPQALRLIVPALPSENKPPQIAQQTGQ